MVKTEGASGVAAESGGVKGQPKKTTESKKRKDKPEEKEKKVREAVVYISSAVWKRRGRRLACFSGKISENGVQAAMDATKLQLA